MKKSTQTNERTTDTVNSNDWLEAMRFIGDTTQSCPGDMFDWDHPKTCPKACRPEFDEIARECWGLYIKEKASNK